MLDKTISESLNVYVACVKDCSGILSLEKYVRWGERAESLTQRGTPN